VQDRNRGANRSTSQVKDGQLRCCQIHWMG
jgi:hypothetical protein